MGIAEKTITKKINKIKQANISIDYSEFKYYEHEECYSIKEVKIILDQMIEPQMRPRKGKFNIYDPLAKYKKILIDKVKNELDKKNITIPIDEDKYYIESIVILRSQPPKSFTKKKKLLALLGLLKFNKKPDIDNCVKTIYDSFEKIFFFNDSQIVKEQFSKVYGLRDETIIIFKIYEQPNTSGRLTNNEIESIEDEYIKKYIKEN